MAENRKVALVTGGGAGIGEATCLRLARNGMAVGVLGRRIGNASAVADAITAAGGTAFAVEADVAEREQVVRAVARVREQLGPILVLVNNAGVEDFTPFAEIDESAWDRIMEVNLKGTYNATQAVLPDMEAAGWGRIVNLTALGAQIGAANMVHYTASKGGITSMTRSLAIELGPKGITVNAIAPGFFATEANAEMANDPAIAEWLRGRTSLGRWGRPEEIAGAAVFLASEAASFVTGHLLVVDGGHVSHF